MKIGSISFQNFKTFGDTPVFFSFNSLTALIGENSVGKSNVLEALDIFFNYSQTKISINSFHHDNYKKAIKIEITFINLNESELKVFKSHLNENATLTITQKIEAIPKDDQNNIDNMEGDEVEFIESKHGTKLQPPEDHPWLFYEEGKPPTKLNIKNWWKSDLKIGDLDFKTFFDDKTEPSQEKYQDALKRIWEQNGDKIPMTRIIGDEKILGWKGKLKANLPKYFYVPAVKNVAEDLKITKTSALGELIGWLSSSVSKEIKQEFKAKSASLIDELMQKIDQGTDGLSKIKQINNALNENVGFDIGCTLELKFGSPEIQDIVFPQPKVFANDGYSSELTEKGHGVQRLALFSLLRTYNTFDFGKTNPDRNIIIGIEEPEIYLHPPLKRSVYKLLRRISSSRDQIIYTTHDSIFISVENFDEVRVFRKTEESNPVTRVYELSLASLVDYYKNKLGISDASQTSLRHRYKHIIDENKNEGFFAKKIILIEGETEKYSLPIYFEACGFDIDNKRISLINAGSVDNITYLLLIFNEFRIPCYVIFDGDHPGVDVAELEKDKTKKDDAKNKTRRNKEIFKYLGKAVGNDAYFFPETSIDDNFSVWKHDFETEFHKKLANYDDLKSAAKRMYNTDSKPLTARYIAEQISANPENINPMIGQIIEKLELLKWRGSIFEQD